MIDPAQLVKGNRVKLNDGTLTYIFGAYMSSNGLVITTKESPDQLVERNVPVDKIAEVISAGGQ